MLVDKKFNLLKPIKKSNLLRLGRNSDGGYVVNLDAIKKCNILISFGMGSDWSFELDYIKKNNNGSIHIYDYTVSASPYIKEIIKYFRRFITFRSTYIALIERLNNFYNYKKFLSLRNVNFYKEKITDKITNKIDSDINKVFQRIKKEEVILKCDIEGSEYKIIDHILEHNEQIQMLIVEFHWIDKNEEEFLEAIKKLKNYFQIVHIHGNNHFQEKINGLPIILEITFLKTKYVKEEKTEYIKEFPIEGLDYPCNSYKEDLTFYFE
tara:strand:+ start:2540 stop:3337 length:798 start_codon:yes stop_codon:yes gene_type:complete